MADTLSPFVYWGQNIDYIYLKIALKEIKDPKINLDDEKLDFQASAHGENGIKDYACSIYFYHEIDSQKSKYRITERNVEFQICKTSKESWPRLTYDPLKPAWLKIDFDHFSFDDSSEEEELNEDQYDERMMEKIKTELGLREEKAYLDIRLIYMVMYNLFQWVGYSMVFCILLYRLWKDGPESRTKAFELVGDQLTIVQVCAVLEIIHPIIGWVKTGVFMPLIQVFGRNMALFMIIASEPKVAEREVVWFLFMAWCSVELIRYPYYMLQSVKKEVKIITWLRYTMWIPLYPLGFFCEGLIMILAVPYFERSGKWTVSLPNQFNIAFHFPTFLNCYMIAFLLGMYLLMTRMYEQRKKKLASKPLKKKIKVS